MDVPSGDNFADSIKLLKIIGIFISEVENEGRLDPRVSGSFTACKSASARDDLWPIIVPESGPVQEARSRPGVEYFSAIYIAGLSLYAKINKFHSLIPYWIKNKRLL
jgi:hypothetical protein